MKTLGLIGGTSWVSTIDYYRIINQEINNRLGRLNSAKICLYSVNYEEFKPGSDWDRTGKEFSAIAKNLERSGAECLLFCANTPHMVADIVQENIAIPLIHIAEVTAKEIKKQKIKTVGLLGTKFTMEQTFFKSRLTRFEIDTLIPDEVERQFIHDTIFDELGIGLFKEETKARYFKIIQQLVNRGAQGIIFGCTEIPLLIKASECNVPVFDTMLLHAKAAVDFALS